MLKPTIQTRDNGIVVETAPKELRPVPLSLPEDSGIAEELESYARQLLDSLNEPAPACSRPPSRSPSRNGRPSSALSNRSQMSIRSGVIGFHSNGPIQGEKDLSMLEEGCSHAVDVISRHSSKGMSCT